MENIIIKYLNGSASYEEKQQLLEWLKENGNKKIFTDTSKVWLASENIVTNKSEINIAFDRFVKNVQSYESKKRVRSRFVIARTIVAASIFIAIFSVGMFLISKKSTPFDKEYAAVMNSIIIGENSKDSVLLPDGSIVWLNSNSKLTYPEKFAEDKRIVKLEGEGYFDVIKNSKCPFIVEMPEMKVNVLGTQFEVKNRPNAKYIETILVSGKVKVTFKDIAESFILSPDEKITYDKNRKEYKITTVDAKEKVVWANDDLVFSNEKLSDILRKLENWYNIEIECSKNVNLDQRLSFIVREESKEELFRIISVLVPIEYNIEENKVSVYHKK